MNTTTTGAAAPRPPALPPVHTLPPAPTLERADLATLHHLLPEGAKTLLRVLGEPAAWALLSRWPGLSYPVPKYRDANAAGAQRWAELAAVVGEAAMPALCGHWGGGELRVPICAALLAHKRQAWLCARFDALTSPHGAAMATHAAVRELGLALAEAGQPMSHRQIETALNQGATAAPAAPPPTNPAQADLFDDLFADIWSGMSR